MRTVGLVEPQIQDLSLNALGRENAFAALVEKVLTFLLLVESRTIVCLVNSFCKNHLPEIHCQPLANLIHNLHSLLPSRLPLGPVRTPCPCLVFIPLVARCLWVQQISGLVLLIKGELHPQGAF